MSFYIKGNLSGYLCEDCLETLENVTILLYSARSGANVTAAAVADPKETFRLVTDKEKEARKELLITKAVTGIDGNFIIEVPDNNREQAFDIDFVCDTVPGRQLPPKGNPQYQFHLTTVYPKWRQDDRQNSYFQYDYIISSKWWCFIRGRLFDAWVICGRFVHCKTGAALPGLTVKAFDADLITDDLLGSAVTDAGGHFRIDYTSADFKKTFLSPLINIETDILSPFFSSGPDVYFKLEFGGTQITFETSANRRNNVGYCLCVHLCVDNFEIPDPVIPASFTHIGRIFRVKIQDEINPASGKTLRPGFDDYAFFSSIPLIGTLSKKLDNQPMEYIFEYQEVAAPGNPLLPGGWQPVTPSMINETIIGYLWTPTGDPINPIDLEPFYVNGPGVNTANFNGNWIQMPQNANFAPHIDAEVLVLNTEKLMPIENIDVNTMTIGNATVPGVAPHVANRYFALRMRQRQVNNAATEVVAGTSRALAVFNARYNNVSRHGSWVPTKVNGQLAVCSMDIQEIASGSGGCGNISNTLHVKYNARNENLGTVSLHMIGPAKPGQTFSFPAIAITTPEVFGTTSPVISPVNNVADLLPCAYTIFLNVTVLLTNGDSVAGTIQDFISFCKLSEIAKVI